MAHPHLHMSSRPMLACADGSFLPLVAKYDAVAHAQVFELDANLCRDVQLVVRREVSPPKHHAGLAMTPDSQIFGHGDGGRGACAYGGAPNEQVPILDYQARINAIVAENRQREQTTLLQRNPIPPQQHNRTSSTTTTTTPADLNDNKEYCTYWIRTGECDYVQQGCRYKHEMPSLEKLKDIGFTKGFPRWWQEKVQYARPAVVVGANGAGGGSASASGAPRMKHDAGAFRRMVDAHLAKHGEKGKEESARMGSASSSASSSASGSGSESEASVRIAVPAVRPRVVSVQPKPTAKAELPPLAQQTTTQAQSTPPKSTPAPTITPSKPVAIQSKPKPQHPADLLDLISDSESDSLQPALKAPNNSPEHQPVLRQGRFIPHNESIAVAAPAPATSPSRAELRSPSPLLLETPRTLADVLTLKGGDFTEKMTELVDKPLPVGYQRKDQSSAKHAVEPDLKVRLTTKTKIKRIEELEAELAKLKPSSTLRTELTKGDTGLAKSRYAARTEKVKTPLATRTSPSGKSKRRGRVQMPPLPTKKAVSAKALRGLQESRERDEKAKEVASGKKVEQASKQGVAEVEPATLLGYKYIFAETE